MRIGREHKEAGGFAQEQGGTRGAAHALANVGVAASLALAGAFHTEVACWRLAMVGALAAAAFDTGATELGQAWGRRAYRLIGLEVVRPGTMGAVSAVGTLGGAGAALVVTVSAVAAGVLSGREALVVVPAAALGSFAESAIASSARGAAWLDHHARNVLNTAVGAGAAVLLARSRRGRCGGSPARA
jgi:uncharacterized protein (TIGR00297 family)